MGSRSRLPLILLAATSIALTDAHAAHPSSPIKRAVQETIRNRATNYFAAVTMLKPVTRDTPGLEVQLAPLLMHEHKLRRSPDPRVMPGSVSFPGDRVKLDPGQPAVYWSTDVTLIHSKPHPRFAYIWFYPDQKRPAPKRVQGVRVTLSSDGYPAIWEVLTDSSDAQVVYAARSVEAKAGAEYGKPLPGCQFATERRGTRTVVARVLEDGPVPMGPIIYLARQTHDVASLVCRCMPSQAASVSSTETYTLLPQENLPRAAPGHERSARTKLPAIRWPDNAGVKSLEERLRLPANF